MSVKSIQEQIESLEAQVAAITTERDALSEGLDKAKAELQTKVEELASVRDDRDASKNEFAAKLAANDEALQKLQTELAEKAQALDEANDKLKLSAFGDVGDGAPPVADGGQGGDQDENPVEKVKTLTGRERIAYYREHQAEIDARWME